MQGGMTDCDASRVRAPGRLYARQSSKQPEFIQVVVFSQSNISVPTPCPHDDGNSVPRKIVRSRGMPAAVCQCNAHLQTPERSQKNTAALPHYEFVYIIRGEAIARFK